LQQVLPLLFTTDAETSAMWTQCLQDNDGKDVALFTKTIELVLSAESVENEEEQRRHMCVCLVCNKLAPHKHAAHH
jgi:hypothetical protein